MPARLTIQADRLVTENWNRPTRSGPIDPENFRPDPKNPLIASFFVNAGLADTLGSGVRNLYKYTHIYSGQDPQLIEGDIFTTIIPLTRPTLPSTLPDGSVDGSVDVLIGDGLSESDRIVLQAIRSDPTLTIKRMVKFTGVSERQIARSLIQLQDNGFLRREGGDRYGNWVVID